LDWIVMKALEKDRNRRYETASAFAADVHRYLDDEPVQACPPSALYRFRKFARRNRVPLAIAASAALLVLLVVAGLATGMVLLGQANTRIEEQRDVARQKQQLARDAVDEMYSDVAEEWLSSQPGLQPVQRKFLQKALRYYEEFAKDDDTDPDVRMKRGIAYFRIGKMEDFWGTISMQGILTPRPLQCCSSWRRIFPISGSTGLSWRAFTHMGTGTSRAARKEYSIYA
jgi:hypothetical protein